MLNGVYLGLKGRFMYLLKIEVQLVCTYPIQCSFNFQLYTQAFYLMRALQSLHILPPYTIYFFRPRSLSLAVSRTSSFLHTANRR